MVMPESLIPHFHVRVGLSGTFWLLSGPTEMRVNALMQRSTRRELLELQMDLILCPLMAVIPPYSEQDGVSFEVRLKADSVRVCRVTRYVGISGGLVARECD
eukprot:762790-Hanusia_phi.AAC.6